MSVCTMSSIRLLTLIAVLALGTAHAFSTRPQLVSPAIIDGRDTDITEAPYQLSLRSWFLHSCGATILSKYYALTAANCFRNSEHAVRYGFLAGAERINAGKAHFVRSIAIHPEFSKENLDYDVAVVRIWRGFGFNDRIQPVSLVPEGRKPASGTPLTIYGWGITSNEQTSEKFAQVLQSAEVTIIPQENCIKLNSYFNKITDRMFCAAAEIGHADACDGDEGGPIVNLQTGQQVGIISWGILCGVSYTPRVFTDLSNAEIRSFIEENSKD